MNGVNLIPAQRRLNKSRRLWVKRWAIVVAAEAVMVVGVWVACLGWGRNTPDLREELAAVQSKQARLKRSIELLSPRIRDGAESLKTAVQVYSRPDWSVLLAVLAQQMGDQLVLSRCRLWPQAGGASSGPALAASEQVATVVTDYRTRRFRLELAGVARSQQSVSEFLLRLERSGLFDAVTLVNTHPAEFLSQSATGFEILCTLDADGAQP